ncbi:MAG: hypothetical protein HYV07_30595 [Deltaproteobacteria bacterium]|nr:hypothetical protein [Deltaproteobacteria bacterium]
MVPRSVALVGLVSLASCGSEPKWLPLPSLDGSKTLILGTGRAGEIREAIAFDAESLPDRIALAANHDGMQVFAGLYDEPVDELTFELGPLELDPSAPTVPLPNSTFEATTPSLQWEASNGGGFTRLRVKQPTSCLEFRQEPPIPLGAHDGDVTYGIKLPDESVLLGTSYFPSYHAYRYFPGGRVEPVLTENQRLNSAVLAPDGTLWLGGTGEVISASIQDLQGESRLEISSRYPFPPSLNGSRDFVFSLLVRTEPALEIFALTGMGQFLRFHEETWTLIHDYSWQSPLWASGGLVDLGADGVLAAWSGSARIARYFDGRVSLEGPPDVMEGFTAIGNIEGVGVLAGTANGKFYARAPDGRWSTFGASGLSLNVLEMIPFQPGGFLAGGSLGLIDQYSSTDGFCPPFRTEVAGVRVIIPLGPHEILLSGFVSSMNATQTPQIVILRH